MDGAQEPATEWAEYLEARVAWFDQCFAPATLLRNAGGSHHNRREQFWVGIDGSHGAPPHTHHDAVHWPRLKTALPAHPRVAPTWAWMVESNLRPRFVAFAQTAEDQLSIDLSLDDATMAAIIARAKPAMGVVTEQDSAHFDQWLELFLNQNCTLDDAERDRWRTGHRLVGWPWQGPAESAEKTSP